MADMNHHQLFIYKNIVENMQEGIMTVNNKGCITAMNHAGMKILSLNEEDIGHSFLKVLIEDGRNDDFYQAILDAVYQKQISHKTVVDYAYGDKTRKLFVSTSYLMEEDEKIGIIVVMNDYTDFGRYLSNHIVQKILETDSEVRVGGEKKTGTLMFTDLRGFTAISDKMNPDKLIKMLNHYLEEMIGVIMEHKGMILDFIGDAIVIGFGIPQDEKDAADDALLCAFQMQKQMRSVNAYNDENQFPQLEMGIGIHTGEVTVGNIGSEKKLKYDVIGRNVNLASRVESYAVGGQILITEATRKCLKNDFTFDSKIEIMPKGVHRPITVYQAKTYAGEELEQFQETWIEYHPPKKSSVRILDEKMLRDEKIDIEIEAYSERKLKIKSSYDFQLYSNIYYENDQMEVYGKIIAAEDDVITIVITYKEDR